MRRNPGRSPRRRRATVERLESRDLLAVFLVTSVADSGPGTLRAAIETANARPGRDRVIFRIAAEAPSIALDAPLPIIVDSLAIDASTQPGARDRPLVELNGAGAGPAASGLVIRAPRSVVSGLVVNRFARAGISVETAAASRSVIQGNFIGTDITGELALPNGLQGIYAGPTPNDPSAPGPHDLLIGGPKPRDRNVVSGNLQDGIRLLGPGTGRSRIVGNFIGTNASGTRALGNGASGIDVVNSARNTIGGRTEAEGNLCSGNGFIAIGSGIQIVGSGSVGNLVVGNRCGTDRSGTFAIPNAIVGIGVGGAFSGEDGYASFNTIGGSLPGSGNLTSGNVQSGIFLSGAGARGNVVQGNRSGTDASGTRRLPNGRDGIQIARAADNLIGGRRPGEGNLLSGNNDSGLSLLEQDTHGNRVEGNTIGADVSGTRPLGNGANGISASPSLDVPSGIPYANTIGGSRPGAGNLISANGFAGVLIIGPTNASNIVQGNILGADRTGSRPLGNVVGIHLESPGNLIADNLLSGNSRTGIELAGPDALGNTITRNRIGTEIGGRSSLGNQRVGIALLPERGASGEVGIPAANTIGGTEASAGNLIAGQAEVGIVVFGDATPRNRVIGNTIGVDASGTAYLPNAGANFNLEFLASIDTTPNVYTPRERRARPIRITHRLGNPSRGSITAEGRVR
ncbi:MAG: hypothetical protein SFX72_15415 [Isosphaeraceae bacterium]|nr:hypothetical protein [Isosphaeraceae bacterium]